MTRGAAACFVWWIVLSMPMPAAEAAWWWLDTHTFRGKDDRPVRATVVGVDLAAARGRIVSVPFETAASNSTSAERSLRDFAELLAQDRRYQGHEWIAVNGGFSSYRVNVPLGLLVIDRKVHSTITLEKAKRSNTVESADYGQLRWAGILCASEDDRRWEIIPAIRYTPGLCRQAMQSGPVVVEPLSRVGIRPDEPDSTMPYKRTVVCLSNRPQIRIIVTIDDTHLFPLATWLSQSENRGGLGCTAALNLSGDSSSGMAIKSAAAASITYVGDGHFPIPSALIFQAR
jgi:uncharacterized protein YigE (DUF2233 family)